MGMWLVSPLKRASDVREFARPPIVGKADSVRKLFVKILSARR